jgi:hypothetical protein
VGDQPIAEQSPAPIVTATPAARTLQVEVEGLFELGPTIAQQATATLVEKNLTRPLAGQARFADLPLGSYTVRVSIPGFADSETKVEISGANALDNPLKLPLGEPLPIVPNKTFLRQDSLRGNTYTLMIITDTGVISTWSHEFTQVRGWSPDLKTLQFVSQGGYGGYDQIGIGRISAGGKITWDWQPPKDVRGWQARPDLSEVTYVQNKDIFSLATTADAKPMRWSKVGTFNYVAAWFDNDTVIADSETGLVALHRDGSTVQLAKLYTQPNRIFDRQGALRFIESEGVFGQPGKTTFEQHPKIPGTWRFSSPLFYGWTSDNKYFLVHSADDKPGATSGLFAIGQDGSARQIAPDMVTPNRDHNRHAIAWDFAPDGSKMALVWRAEGQDGIYIIDAESGKAERISTTTPDTIKWPQANALVYTFEQGDQIGTWLQPIAGGQAQHLFAYRATQSSQTPDGKLLLDANKTLWLYSGSGEPAVLGEEGKAPNGKAFVWPKQL